MSPGDADDFFSVETAGVRFRVLGDLAPGAPLVLACDGHARAFYVERGRFACDLHDDSGPVILGVGDGFRISSQTIASVEARAAGSRAVLLEASCSNSQLAEPTRRFALHALDADELRPGTERRSVQVGEAKLMFIRYRRPTIASPHQHVHSSLIYIERGEFMVDVEEESRMLAPGAGLVIQPQVRHGLRTATDEANIVEVWWPVPSTASSRG